MSWQSTLVGPVNPARPHRVQVTCRWCPWRSVVLDTTTETGRAQIRSVRLRHECATSNPDRVFEDLVDAYNTPSELYAAVLRTEQENPDDLPVIIGMRAWALLDERQQREHFTVLLQSYVELVRIQREEDQEGQ